jgi:hypothetical protein
MVLNKTKILQHIVPLSLILAAGAILSVRLGQDQSWDLFNYHYYNAFSLLHGRAAVDVAAASSQTYWNPFFDVLPYVIINHFAPIVAGAILGAIQSLNVFLVYEISLVLLAKFVKAWQRVTLALLAAATSFGASVYLAELGTMMGDNTTAMLVLAGLLLQLWIINGSIRTPRMRTGARIASYALVGFATAIKLTNAPFAVSLLLLEIFSKKKMRVLARRSFGNVLAVAAGYVAGGGVWQYHLWSQFRSPLFPLYNSIFQSPYYPDRNILIVVLLYFPDNILQALFYPFYWIRTQRTIGEVYFHDPRLAILYSLLGVLAVLLIGQKVFRKKLLVNAIPVEYKATLLFVVASFVLWEALLSNIRYLMPVFLLAAPVILVTAIVIMPNKRWGVLSGVTLLLVTIFTTSSMSWGRIEWQPSWFGVQMPYGYISDDPTVITSGNEPLAFLIPYLPPKSQVINVDGFIYSSNKSIISPRMQQLLDQRIAARKAAGSQFYTITTSSNLELNESDLNNYGFKIKDCRPIVTNIDRLTSRIGAHKICMLYEDVGRRD